MLRITSVGLIAATVLLVPLGVAGTASADVYYASCKEAFAAGQSNIRIGEPGYRPALDRNRDGVACESGDSSTGTGTGSNSGNSNEDESTSSEQTSSESSQSSSDGSSQSSSDEESDSSSSDQVEVVPNGGAETGDGSTAGDTGWWLGGGFLAALAGLFTARRVRPGARTRA